MIDFLVTGGAGFIGSNLVLSLIRGGYSARILDNFSTGRRENLLPIMHDVEVIEGVQAGERVVVRGAFMVKLAASAADVPAHGHAH